jgi:hypothetical protein
MPTVYVDLATGDDARTYAQAQVSTTPWANPLKADASAVALDIVEHTAATYQSTAYTGAPTFFSFAKGLSYKGNGSVFRGTSASYIGRISAGLADSAVLSFDNINFNANSAANQSFDIGDMAAKVWTISWTNCEFSGANTNAMLMTFNKRGVFSTADLVLSGSPSVAGWNGASAVGAGGIAGTGALSVTHTRPRFNLSTTGGLTGILQNITGGTPVNTISYIVDAPTGTIETSSTTASIIGVDLRCPGAEIRNSDNSGSLKIIAPDASTGDHRGVVIQPSSANLTNRSIKRTRGEFLAPGGYAVCYGDTTGAAAGTITGGELSGNIWKGKYYAGKTPHGLNIANNTSASSISGNDMRDFYCNYLASKTTSGTSQYNYSKDAYGVDYYIKGCTAFTWKGVTAVQSGKYPRRLLAPFSIDSQGGVLNVAGGFDSCVFICAEPDFSRVGALANITINNTGSFVSTTYIIPDTWDTNTTDRFFVGGTEGGRTGATGYTIDEWLTGTAGSVSPTNGTGTLTVSGTQIIQKPIGEIRQMISSGAVGGILSGLLGSVLG